MSLFFWPVAEHRLERMPQPEGQGAAASQPPNKTPPAVRTTAPPCRFLVAAIDLNRHFPSALQRAGDGAFAGPCFTDVSAFWPISYAVFCLHKNHCCTHRLILYNPSSC